MYGTSSSKVRTGPFAVFEFDVEQGQQLALYQEERTTARSREGVSNNIHPYCFSFSFSFTHFSFTGQGKRKQLQVNISLICFGQYRTPWRKAGAYKLEADLSVEVRRTKTYWTVSFIACKTTKQSRQEKERWQSLSGRR